MPGLYAPEMTRKVVAICCLRRGCGLVRWLFSALGNSQRGLIAVLSQQHCIQYKVCLVRGGKEEIAHFIKDDQGSLS